MGSKINVSECRDSNRRQNVYFLDYLHDTVMRLIFPQNTPCYLLNNLLDKNKNKTNINCLR